MKVILLQNVPKLGQKDQIKDVNEGYALNFLIPRKLAKIATSGEVKNINNKKENKAKSLERLQEKAHAILNKINGKEFVLQEKANEKGHLFAQIHVKEIADVIGDAGFDISEDWLILDKPIKQTGKHNIELLVYNKKGSVILNVAGKAK